MGIEKIREFEFSKLSDGNANGIKDFFKKIVKPQFSNRQDIVNTHNALMEYLKTDGKVFFLRLYGSYPKDRYFLLRRGFLTEYPDKTKMAFCDNTFSMLFAGLKIAGLTYTSSELKSYLTQNKVISSFLTTTEERELSYYNREGAINLNLNSKGWYLAHIKPTGTGFNKRGLRDIFPNPPRSEWDIATKIRRTKTNLNDNELNILKAHFIRLIHPLNSFLVPKKNHLSYFGKNIGEETELLSYTQDFLKNEFQKEYEEFNNITLEYDFPKIHNTIDEISWFKDKIKKEVNKKRNEKTEMKKKPTNNKRTINGMKIGKFVQHVFRDAFEKKIFSIIQTKNLQELEFSINTFNSRYEVLRAKEKTIKDENGRNRYYASELFCGGYHLTSQWVEPQWDILLKWLNGLGYEINENELNEIEIPIIKKEKTSLSDSEEIEKVRSKIPNWLKNTDQINSKILINYMELLKQDNSVLYKNLENSCSSIPSFKSNYNQMKTISIKNHAKVFEEVGGVITLWLPVKEFIKVEYEKIKNL